MNNWCPRCLRRGLSQNDGHCWCQKTNRKIPWLDILGHSIFPHLFLRDLRANKDTQAQNRSEKLPEVPSETKRKEEDGMSKAAKAAPRRTDKTRIAAAALLLAKALLVAIATKAAPDSKTPWP